MTVVAGIAFMVVHMRGVASSIRVTDMATEVRLLLGFVLGGYITQCVDKWIHITAVLGTVMNQLMKVMKTVDIAPAGVVNDRVRAKVFRYCRVSLQLLFFTGCRETDLSQLVMEGMLSEKERQRLIDVPLCYRSDVLCGWLEKLLMQVQLQEQCGGFIESGESLLAVLLIAM
jgi:hypothetical protein